MITVRDQLGRTVAIDRPAMAIVSLVPSLTDLLASLQLDDYVLGLTKFCIHPAGWKNDKVVVGGTKKIHHKRIEELCPDLIIVNKEENTEADVLQLGKKYSVYISDIKNLSDCYQCILDIGLLTNRREESILLINQIKEAFQGLHAFRGKKKVAYCIWKNPWMFAGRGTFIDHMLTQAGLINAVKQTRYPEITLDNLADLNLDFLFLSSEPFPFNSDHLKELAAMLPDTKITLVDGELFSWYGSKVLEFPPYINSLFQKLNAS